jgi:hypothetical protein
MTEPGLSHLRSHATLYGAWISVFVATVVAYWPGLSGPWLLDDFGSLAKLGDYGGVRDWDTFKTFVFGGTAGPTGRPLALLTFLIDGQNWPTEAWPFKRTNLVIHVLSGALLGVLISQILSALDYEKKTIRSVALVAAACWMLHPFFVSTTLYVVQRMAQLSTLFIFAGLVGYLYGRALLKTKELPAYLVMSASLGIFTILAMISKENGILLPVLALALELTIFSSAAQPKLNRYWLVTFLIAPSAVIFLYLGRHVVSPRFYEITPPRDYSGYERLLTQSRVLVDYLQNLLIPKLYTTGVFQDHVLKSTSLLTPVSTLFSTAFHMAMIGFALVFRRHWPLVSLSILFFYAGHLLESTVINLELYFEHRNYLSAALLFLPLTVLLHRKLNARMFFLVSIIILALLGGFTRYSATIWKDYDLMAATSAQKAPTSARAQSNLAASLFSAGHADASLAVLDHAIEEIGSTKPILLVQKLVLSCHAQRLELPEFERLSSILGETTYDARLINTYKALAEAVATKRCPVIPASALESLFQQMLKTMPNGNPRGLRYAQLNYFLGYVRAYSSKPGAAVDAFEASLGSRPSASSAMAMAAVLAENQHQAEALRLSEIALQLLGRNGGVSPDGSMVTETDIRSFQEIVRAGSGNPTGDDTLDPAQ